MADIRVNDVPLFRRDVNGQVTAELPFNYLIESSGLQRLSISIIPNLSSLTFIQGASCDVEIWRYDGSEDKLIPIEKVCSLSIQIGSEEITIPMKTVKKIFVAEVAYKINRWSGCKTLESNRITTMAVADFFRNVGLMLSRKQYNDYDELIFDKESSVCTALALDVENAAARKQMLLDCLNGDFEFKPMTGKKLIEYYADRRIVTMLDQDMRSALRFENRQTGEILAIELFLGYRKGEKVLKII